MSRAIDPLIVVEYLPCVEMNGRNGFQKQPLRRSHEPLVWLEYRAHGLAERVCERPRISIGGPDQGIAVREIMACAQKVLFSPMGGDGNAR